MVCEKYGSLAKQKFVMCLLVFSIGQLEIMEPYILYNEVIWIENTIKLFMTKKKKTKMIFHLFLFLIKEGRSSKLKLSNFENTV